MKNTEKKRMSARRRRRRRNRILLTILICILFAGCCTLAFFQLKKGYDLDISHSYLETSDFAKNTDAASLMTAPPFAHDLCVAPGDVEYDNLSLNGNEKGALFDVDDKKVIFGKSLYEKVYPASITKIMTAILAVKYGNMDDVITITEEDVTLEEGSQMVGFQTGDTVTMDELFHGLLVYSGNDCAMAIARHIGGTVENFVAMMNEEVKSLGATGTHFVSPHGLHDDNHYTTVYDIYLMLNEAITFPYFVETMQLGKYTISYTRGEETITARLDATDHYLTGEDSAPADVTVLGGKTGTTSAAGSCLAILSQNRYGEPYVSIVMKAVNKVTLYSDMNKLLSEINS